MWPSLALAQARSAFESDVGAADAGAPLDGGLEAGAGEVEAPVEIGRSEARPALESEGPGDEAPVVAPLPAIEPDPSVAPVIDGSAERLPVAPGERPGVVIKTILGLLALMVLAYLGGHPRVLRWEERLGISQVITTGFPFVILGLIARAPGVGILGDAILAELSPLLRLGLGWIGFVVGFRFDTRMFQGLPQSTLRMVTLATALPFVLVVGACAPLMLALESAPLDLGDPVFLRDALILGTCGTMTALASTRGLSNGSSGVLAKVVRLEELAGIIGLAFVAAFFRPQGATVSWQIPGTAWVLLTIGLGVITGLIIYAILYRSSEGVDFLVLTLGSISFSAGAAGYLLLSSVVVAFIAGVLLANFPGAYHARLRAMLDGLERPIYLVSLVIVGALWDVGDWRGWLLMPAFMATRLLGKWLGTYLSLRDGALRLEPGERRALELPALGPLAIAIVINAQLLYPGGSISLIVSAVIGGGVLTEIFIQLSNRRRKRMGSDPAPSSGELVNGVGYSDVATAAVDTSRREGSEP
jgi:hypothetical protein